MFVCFIREGRKSERPLPVLGLRVFEMGVDDLEGSGQCDAQATGNRWQLGLGLIAIDEVQRWGRGQMCKNARQRNFLIHAFEDLDALLQTFGDCQVEWLDDLAAVCPGDRFSTEEEVMHLAVDELAVSLEVCLVDVESGGGPEEAFELR